MSRLPGLPINIYLIAHVKDRPAHDFRYAMDFKKLKRLGWEPQFDFKRALDITVEWYKDKQQPERSF